MRSGVILHIKWLHEKKEMEQKSHVHNASLLASQMVQGRVKKIILKCQHNCVQSPIRKQNCAVRRLKYLYRYFAYGKLTRWVLKSPVVRVL